MFMYVTKSIEGEKETTKAYSSPSIHLSCCQEDDKKCNRFDIQERVKRDDVCTQGKDDFKQRLSERWKRIPVARTRLKDKYQRMEEETRRK